MRWSAVAFVAVLLIARPALPQEPRPAFDVTSVKANPSGRPFGTIAYQPGGFSATNATLAELMRSAYGLQPSQLAGGPAWISTARFDVNARTSGGAQASPAMLQALLADRFSLRVRRETRELPLFALVAARADRRPGPQLRPSSVDCAAVKSSGAAVAAAAVPGRELCDAFTGPAPRMSAVGVTMPQLAESLARHVRDVVVDRTAMTGAYDFELQWTPAGLPRPAAGAEPMRLNGFVVDPDGPSIFTALQEQLGLKLEPEKGPVPVIVVDGASMPMAD